MRSTRLFYCEIYERNIYFISFFHFSFFFIFLHPDTFFFSSFFFPPHFFLGLPNDIVAVSINYMDMYLSRRQVDKINLQLLAMVCIFVASKFHEVEPISILELQTLAEGGYTESSIRKFF